MLGASGAVGLGALVAANTAATPMSDAAVEPMFTPADFPDAANTELETETAAGPFYFDAERIRSDIREDRVGTELLLGLMVCDQRGRPVRDALVDIWHVDANGDYSSFEGIPPEDLPLPGEPLPHRVSRSRFLRGAQVTNRHGIVQFVTIYPGWYPIRTVHIHYKVYLDDANVATSELNFPDEFSYKEFSKPPYLPWPDDAVTNANDPNFFPRNLMTVRPPGNGYRATMTLNVRDY